MFRDTNGKMGAMAEACPHRGASLFFGRVEDCGIRCQYHGWKFDHEGNLMEVPTEKEGSRAQQHYMTKVKARSYPCHEVSHMIWVYMGPRDTPPPFPAFEVNTLPADQVQPAAIMMEEANWVQNMEGDLDSIHLNWLHRRLEADSPTPPLGIRGFWSPDPETPEFDVERTDYGAYYSSQRKWTDDRMWHRINQFIFPFHTMISVGAQVSLRSFVPVDDHHTMLMTQSGLSDRPVVAEPNFGDPFGPVGGYMPRTNDPRSYFVTVANKRNDYWRDLDVEKKIMHCGIPFVLNLPDRAMTELMCDPVTGEPLYDRTRENLGSSDVMVIAVRAQLINAAKRFRDTGGLPVNVDDVSHNRVRCASVLLPRGVDWRVESALARSADSGRTPNDDVNLIID